MNPPRVASLIDEISNILSWEEFSERKEHFLDEITKIGHENQNLQFKFERSIKEKNILSSVLTKTSADLKMVSENLKIRAEELSTLLSTIPAYVYFKDINLNYIIVNKSFENLVGIPVEQIKGKKTHEILPDYHPGSYIEKELEVINSCLAIYNIEEEFKRNEDFFWVNTSIAPILNTKSQILGLVGISWDITDRKRNEAELLKAKELAEAGTRAKNEFIASVSHEFRTPMAGILGLSDILKNTPLNNEQIELLHGIVTSAENLLVLLNDVLDFSAIEAGKIIIDSKPFELTKILDEIFQVTNLKANEKSLDFIINMEENLPINLIGDPHRLRQIILNLTNNAVKFTEKGKVLMNVKTVKKTDHLVTIRFEVEDTGLGIPESAFSTLFQVFSRVNVDKTKLIAGNGLGLSICKKLTHLMGGEIGAESTLGKGSLFWFMLPFKIFYTDTVQHDLIETENRSFQRKQVLVAEDNPINQRIIDFQLKKMGFDVDLTGNGREAIAKYCLKQYDLIVLDIQMPIMDGYQAAKKIRELEKETAHHTPIIALTANAMKGDRELYLSAGMDDYISKPFTYEVLQKAIDKLLNGNE